MNRPHLIRLGNARHLLIAVVSIVILLIGGYLWSGLRERQRQAAEQATSEQIVRNLVSSEELLLQLTPRLKPLSTSVKNLRLPDDLTRTIFADQVDLSGQFQVEQVSKSKNEADSKLHFFVGQTSESIAQTDLNLWASLFDQTVYFEHAKFYFIKGELVGKDRDQFSSTLGFDALATTKGNEKVSLHANLEVDWTKQKGLAESSAWRITSWRLVDIQSIESSQLLFRDVLAEVIDDPKALVQSTASRHTQLTSHLMAGGEYRFPLGETYPLFFPDVTLEHPGVSVVDIDSDGFDDLYVSMQHDVNLLFHNNGDGTLTESASNYGLDVPGDSTSAIFADFDNDGDQDLFLGRARRPSLYLVNQGGRFVDKTAQWIAGGLPALVSSISAADYNNDGLLDVYLCTYSPIEESNRFQVDNKPMWAELFLTPKQSEEVSRRNRRSHRFLDRAGPPNRLLQNVGDGKFIVAKENPTLELWRMSFQAAWNDFDRDGDQDLYVANDYGPDNLFRNDGDEGFQDITKEAGLTGMGFGMGVAWGDYDNDGVEDVYVSNMYSKAGQRIISQVADLDPRFKEMAQGNFLYHCDNNKFALVSGGKSNDLKVAKSGWSWGGQFLDFDNDGFRDIYATSGYYTAPADIAIELDL